MALQADWDLATIHRSLEANALRYLARDGLLDGLSDEQAGSRFDWQGLDAVEAARAEGRGLIVVGAHYGAHLAALHALYRRTWPLRLLVQRPRHVSRYLQNRFEGEGPRSQARFFVHRGLTTGEAAERILLARAALREGQVVYLNGDIIWPGPNTRVELLLGREHPFLTLWADLAMLTGAPLTFLFARHEPEGRYAMTFAPPQRIMEGEEAQAVKRFFTMLESRIAAHPADAVPYLTWPSFIGEQEET